MLSPQRKAHSPYSETVLSNKPFSCKGGQEEVLYRVCSFMTVCYFMLRERVRERVRERGVMTKQRSCVFVSQCVFVCWCHS